MKVHKFVDQPDGSALMTYSLNNKEEKAIKQVYGVKRLTKELKNKFVLEAIKNYVKIHGKDYQSANI